MSVGYALDNHHAVSERHHAALAALFDPFTRARITGLQRWRPGARCLEVGAGGGSLSQWLADEVATAGQVVALDLKPELIPHHPRLVTLAYDLTGGDRLPELVGAGGFDLIVGRLILGHLPVRDRLLTLLAGLLAPGGWLLLEDFGPPPDQPVVAAPSPADAKRFTSYQRAVWQAFEASGTELGWPLRTWPAMLAAGLGEISAVAHSRLWSGGSVGAQLSMTVCVQLGPRLREAGLSRAQLARASQLLGDPRLVSHTLPLYSTSGQRA